MLVYCLDIAFVLRLFFLANASAAAVEGRVDGVEVLGVQPLGGDAQTFAVAYKVEKVIAFSR